MNHSLSLPALLSTLLLSSAALHADVDPSDVPRNVRHFTVNGVEVIHRTSDPANHVIVAKTFLRGGTSALPALVSPAVHELALEVPVLSGPQGMNREAFQREQERLAIGLSIAPGRDFSTYTLRCTDEAFERSWELYTGIILRPQVDETELRNAKDRKALALRNREENPEAYAEFLADSVFFAGHPYGRFAYESDIAPITAGELADHWKSLFQKSRMLVVVVGNIDSATIAARINATLGTLPQGDYVDVPLPPPTAARMPRLVIRPTAGGRTVTNYLAVRHLAPNQSDSLFYPFMRLASFLAGTLFREIRVDRNLSYAPDADFTQARQSYGRISVSTTLVDSVWRTTKREVIDFFRDNVIADQYITSGLDGWMTSRYLREQTNESQANELGRAQLYTGSWRNAYGVIHGISTITPEQMNLAAQRYLKSFTIVIVGDPDKIDRKTYVVSDFGK